MAAAYGLASIGRYSDKVTWLIRWVANELFNTVCIQLKQYTSTYSLVLFRDTDFAEFVQEKNPQTTWEDFRDSRSPKEALDYVTVGTADQVG